MKDKELIEQLEALEDIVDWLEERDKSDLNEATSSIQVEEEEIARWLETPTLKDRLRWSERKDD